MHDIVTVVIYYYIMIEFHYAKCDSSPSTFGGVMLQRFEFTKVCMGKNLSKHFSQNFDIFAITMTYLDALLSILLSSCFSAQSKAF